MVDEVPGAFEGGARPDEVVEGVAGLESLGRACCCCWI